MTTTHGDVKDLAFNREENELLTRVGPGTLMGRLFRQYWIPVVPTWLLDEAPGTPRRIRLLGEDLVVFRTLLGELGVVGAYCSHRLAPLYFGRIEEDGIRCPYHGWKYAPGGKCIDMPSVNPEQQFKDRIRHPGYPCVEHGGIIWTYMGLSEDLPPVPEFEFLMVPEHRRTYRLFHQECNYLQALEGGIDPTHVMWLHPPYDLSDEEIARRNQPLQHVVALQTRTRTPLFVEIADTPAGFMYGAKRPMGEGKSLWRVNQFLMPFYTMPPGGELRAARMWIPIDDENSIKWMLQWFPTERIMESNKEKEKVMRYDEEVYGPATNEQPYGFIRPKANRANDYLINWETHRTRRMGIAGVNLQDRCVQENEGPTPILDRTKENLCDGDWTIIRARRMLLEAATALNIHGTVPPGARDASAYRFRAAAKVVPDSASWVEGVKEDVTVTIQGA